MVNPNLKVGDTFEDGGLIYEVLNIVPEGYISRKVPEGTKPKPVVKAEPEVVEDIPLKELPFTTVEENQKAQLDSFNKYTKTEINRLNNAELKSVCEKLGIEPGTGVEMKKAIIEKLGL